MSADKPLPLQRRRLFVWVGASVGALLLLLATPIVHRGAMVRVSSWQSAMGLHKSPNAWVFMANSDRTLLHVLVSAKSARIAGSMADVVVLWFDPEPPSKCMSEALASVNGKVRMVNPPILAKDVTNKTFVKIIDKLHKWWDWVKLLTFDLTDYEKVVFLDG
jgi:alpha-N-acetylglucosamine transferase